MKCIIFKETDENNFIMLRLSDIKSIEVEELSNNPDKQKKMITVFHEHKCHAFKLDCINFDNFISFLNSNDQGSFIITIENIS